MKTHWVIVFLLASIVLVTIAVASKYPRWVVVGFLACAVAIQTHYIWKHIVDSDAQASPKSSKADSPADRETLELFIAENAELRAQLNEARKWVPYQDGALMKWGCN